MKRVKGINILTEQKVNKSAVGSCVTDGACRLEIIAGQRRVNRNTGRHEIVERRDSETEN